MIPLRRLLFLGVVLAATALAVGGCSGETTSSQGADLTTGKKLFSQKCGACHTMQAAGTQGTIGPNLDHAFGYARDQDFDQSTFFEVTLHQMEIAIPPMPRFADEGTKDYLPEEDRLAIAAYVSQCANLAKTNPDPACAAGNAQNSTDGKTIFTANCASCHTLQAAGATGTVGPNLDQLKPALQAALTQIMNGGGGMPAFKGTLTDEQIQAVAKFVVDSTSG
ncbi:MAG TPA: c-type cytochrome [Gaiellaceae bacterium]